MRANEPATWMSMTCNKISILCVDDEKDFLRLTKSYLENVNEKFQVNTVSSPHEAIRILETKEHDAIVSDLCMPSMTGLELHQELQKRGISTPFIILSGTSKDEIGMKDREIMNKVPYLRKQANSEKLYTTLSDIIAQEMGKNDSAITNYSSLIHRIL
ncbi:MAG: response regulator [Candidatus Hodarchaeales archaeon]|jgi:CheY-like chemotaxis protein